MPTLPIHAPTENANWRDAALIVAAAVLPYLNTLSAGFCFDDQPQILANPAVVGAFDPLAALSLPLEPGWIFRPVTTLTFALQQASSPNNATGMHAANVMLHACATLSVWWVSWLVLGTRWTALTAAVLFGVHPIHTEAVSSLVGRAEVLAALFLVVSLCCAVKATQPVVAGRRRAWMAMALVSAGLGMSSKENAMLVLPLTVAVRGSMNHASLWRGVLDDLRTADWIPIALVLAVFLTWYLHIIGPSNVTPLENPLAFLPASSRILSALGVLWDYVGLLVLPVRLAAEYSHQGVPIVESWLDLRALAGAFILFSSVATILLSGNRRLRSALILSIGGIILTSNLLFPIGTSKAERLLYLPSAGWAMLCALLIERLWRLPRYRTAIALVGLLYLCFCAGRTWIRNLDWQDDLSLFRATVEAVPRSAKAHFNYATQLERRGADVQAIYHYKEAMALYPFFAKAAGSIGLLHHKRGALDEAEIWYREALAINKFVPGAGLNLSNLLLLRHRYADAIAAYRAALRYRPADTNLLKGLGMSMVAAGDAEKGLFVLEQARRLGDTDPALPDYIDSLRAQQSKREVLP